MTIQKLHILKDWFTRSGNISSNIGVRTVECGGDQILFVIKQFLF